MAIKKLTIEGLRGFLNKTEFRFAIPDKKTEGSGLTIIVGPNNSGKSTLIEAIHLLSNHKEIISKEIRNLENDRIIIEAEDLAGNKLKIQSKENKGAFVINTYNGNDIKNDNNNYLNSFILSPKRSFTTTFHAISEQDRLFYKGNMGNNEYRAEMNYNNHFGERLFKILNNKDIFNNCLEKVIKPIPIWTLEADDANNQYLEFTFGKNSHSSKGSGDGYINIFNIVDALYDSKEDNVIIIDEPEISLHPDLQMKLFNLLLEYSKEKQIIITTHSPYFINWNIISNKGKIIRLKREEKSIVAFELKEETKERIKGLLKNGNNPHILSLNANEIFFMDDNIILTEGQDDVICYKEIMKQKNYENTASFFGWGAGGANNIDILLEMLKELGYRKVFTILDNDQKEKETQLKRKFKEYEFYIIKAEDVRNKEKDKNIEKAIKEIKKLDFIEKDSIINILNKYSGEKEGLITNRKEYTINLKYEEDIETLISRLKNYFSDDESIKDDNMIKKEDINTYFSNQDNLAKELLNRYIERNDIYRKYVTKYDYIQFNGCNDNIISMKKTSENLFYAITEKEEYVDSNKKIVIDFHFLIDTAKKRVKMLKAKEIHNTLPKRYK